MAERVGFEPTIRGYRIHTFQACAFDHSATAPHACLGEGVPLATKSLHRNSGLCMIGWAGGKNVLLESHWTALRGRDIPCERCLKSPFSSSKTRGKGLLRDPPLFSLSAPVFVGVSCAPSSQPPFYLLPVSAGPPRAIGWPHRRACMAAHGRACGAARPVPHSTL